MGSAISVISFSYCASTALSLSNMITQGSGTRIADARPFDFAQGRPEHRLRGE
jgi:hypothetical protein